MAIVELILPKMGEGIMEATIIQWHKKTGDTIKEEETIVDVATDKVDSEVPSTATGVLKEIFFKANDVVPVGTVIARIETEGGQNIQEENPSHSIEQPFKTQEAQVAPVFENTAHNIEEKIPFIPSEASPVQSPTSNNHGRFYSPLVLNIVRSENISLQELETIEGNGADGRVTKNDILAYIKNGKKSSAPTATIQTQQVTESKIQAQPETQSQLQSEPLIEPETPIQQLQQELKPEQLQPQIKQEPKPESKPETQPLLQPEPQIQQLRQEPKPEQLQTQLQQEPKPESKPEPQPQLPSQIPTEPEPVIQKNVYTPPLIIETPTPKIENGSTEIIEMDRMRKLIAHHMVASKQISAHVTSFSEADVTNMVMWREKSKAEFERIEKTKLTFTPMFIECLVKVLKRYPILNSSVEGEKIILKNFINIGMATALPNKNLIVPVIKNAGGMNLAALSKSVNNLANAARNNKLKPDDTQGGTFTFTNVGTFGSLMGTPIINQPQVAILAVGVIKKRPVVIETDSDDYIGIRHMMYLSLSYDHRIIDGSVGAAFLTEVANEFEKWDINKDL